MLAKTSVIRARLAGLLVFLPMLPALGNTTDAGVVPAQFIAKLYTEALGRAPDQLGWGHLVTYFQEHGCNSGRLRDVGEEFYTSLQFRHDYPSDNEARVLALYRGALSRDADQAGLERYTAQLNAGAPWENVVSAVFASDEFINNVPKVCSATTPDYHFGRQTPPQPTPGTQGFSGTQSALQSLLNRAVPGSAVYLAQKAVVTLHSTLDVPSGVALTTYGEPDTTSYALMARLVRGSTFDGPNVDVESGGKLTHVWVDGQRHILGYHKTEGGTNDNANVVTETGADIEVSSNKLSDPQGGTNLYTSGMGCVHETVRANLVTAYSAVHDMSGFSDGLTMACEDLELQDNDVVDATDIGIVLFAAPGFTQHSRITHNTIVSAGNSTNAAIAGDASTGNAGGSSLDFAGTVFLENKFWTGPYTTFDFGVEAGGRPFFALPANNSDGSGATYINNTTGFLSARVRAGIVVAGMLDVTITNDDRHPLDLIPVPFLPGSPAERCPAGAVIVEASAGHASGTYPTPTVDRDFDGCVNQPLMPLTSSEIALTVSPLYAITIRNISTANVVGPFGVTFANLSPGVTLVNATTTFPQKDAAFLAFPEVLSLAPGQSATVQAELTNSSSTPVSFTPLISSGVP